jgi:hypothetical protein
MVRDHYPVAVVLEGNVTSDKRFRCSNGTLLGRVPSCNLFTSPIIIQATLKTQLKSYSDFGREESFVGMLIILRFKRGTLHNRVTGDIRPYCRYELPTNSLDNLYLNPVRAVCILSGRATGIAWLNFNKSKRCMGC